MITIRPVNEGDSTEILSWRNDVFTRTNSLNSKLVSLSEHKQWLSNCLVNPSVSLFLGEVGGEKLGICFFVESKENVAKVSLNLNPKFRGKGLGTHFLKISIDHFLQTWSGQLIAEIKPANVASERCFLSAGFNLANTSLGLNVYSLSSSEK